MAPSGRFEMGVFHNGAVQREIRGKALPMKK